MSKNNQKFGDRMRICVIGAGAAGICVARRVVEQLAGVEVSVFEQTDQLGGTWVYREQNSPGTHSAMYAELRTNIPKEIMEFYDFPFTPADFPVQQNFKDSFPRHEVVLAYLKRFAEPIWHFIRFNSKICSISRSENEMSKWNGFDEKEGKKGRTQWRVQYEQGEPGRKFTELFDAIFVCSGHYWAPRIPDFVAKLGGVRWMHSHSFRRAEHFAGMRVGIVGARLSGTEIALQLVEFAEKVYLINSAQKAAICQNIPSNFVEFNGGRVVDVAEENGGSLFLNDGRVIDQLDFVIFCTGYRYDFPFFDQNLIRCDGNFISPLFAHIVHPNLSDSLFFIGLNQFIAPFLNFDIQTNFALFLIQNESQRQYITIEAAKVWEEQRIKEMKEQNVPVKYFHQLGSKQWEYYDWLNSFSGHKKVPKVFRKIYEYNVGQKTKQQQCYRNICYRIVDENSFETESFMTACIHPIRSVFCFSEKR